MLKIVPTHLFEKHHEQNFLLSKTVPSYNHYSNVFPDYIFNQQLGRCYQLHTKPLNWTDAHAACHAEQGYLAVINSQEEADYLVQLTQTPVKKVSGNFMRGAVHLGFHNRGDDGWQTVRGNVFYRIIIITLFPSSSSVISYTDMTSKYFMII